MPTGLTNLVPDAYAALAVVSRELVGLIPSVTVLPGIERLPLGASLRSPVAPINTAGKDITPAMALPPASEQNIGNVPFVLTKARAFPFSWSGEDQLAADSGPGALTIQQQQIAQAFRAAVKEVSADGYAAARVAASRAYGTAGTTPFDANLGDSAQLKKILDDNGAPMSERACVLNTTAGAAMRTLLNNPLNANTSLNGDLSRQGILIDVNGFVHREEAQIATVTKGTGANYTTTAVGFAVGTTSIPLITGTGTVLAGDVVTFNGDPNKYVVKTGITEPGTIVLQEPGLLKAIPAAATALTVGANFVANLGFSRDAIALGTRLPALPTTRDLAILRETIIDPVSKLAFELAAYPGYRMVTFEIGLAWGWAVENPRHLALLLG